MSKANTTFRVLGPYEFPRFFGWLSWDPMNRRGFLLNTKNRKNIKKNHWTSCTFFNDILEADLARQKLGRENTQKKILDFVHIF